MQGEGHVIRGAVGGANHQRHVIRGSCDSQIRYRSNGECAMVTDANVNGRASHAAATSRERYEARGERNACDDPSDPVAVNLKAISLSRVSPH